MKYKKVEMQERFMPLYKLFSIGHIEACMKEKLFNEGYSLEDVLSDVQIINEFSSSIVSSEKFNADWIAPYVKEALYSRDSYIITMDDVILETLWFIFTTNIGEDIAITIAYNDCVKFINDEYIRLDKDRLEIIIARQLPWHYSYREAIDSVNQYILKAERSDLL